MSKEVYLAQRHAELRNMAERRNRHMTEYGLWSMAEILYNPLWDNWEGEYPLPGDLWMMKSLYSVQQKRIQQRKWYEYLERDNAAKLAKLGYIIPNPNFKPEEQLRLPGITLNPLVKPKSPKPSVLQRFTEWLTR